MPAAKPPEFRRRAVELARSGQLPVAEVAADLGISESCLHADTGELLRELTLDYRPRQRSRPDP